jgi:hypothetical protein
VNEEEAMLGSGRRPCEVSGAGAFARRHARRAARGAAVVALAAASSVAVVGVTAAPASATTEQLVAETFANSTTSSTDWSVPAAPDGANTACLTAGVPSAKPVPGCQTPPIDSSGSGALRLTQDSTTEEGGVAYSLSVPTTEGIDAKFNSYQYGKPGSGFSGGADGIGFFLAAANPDDPQPPTEIGQPGGDLGYSAVGSSQPGMAYGYLGVGLDVYGNYANTTYEGTGCTDPPFDSDTEYPDNVTVRGPGNSNSTSGTTGYCMLSSTANFEAGIGGVDGTLDGGTSGTRSSSGVPVEVVINPGGTAVNMTNPLFSAVSVPAGDYGVAFQSLSTGPTAEPVQTLIGALPQVGADLQFPSGWIDPTNGLPYQVTFGFVGSTGSDVEVHEINNVVVGTANGIPPTLAVSVSNNAGSAPAPGSTMDYSVQVSDAAGSGNDPGPIAVTDTIPPGETPSATGLGQNGWSCGIAGQTVTCSIAGPLDAGNALLPLIIPVTVSSSDAPGTQITNTAIASSDFSDPASGSDTVTVSQTATTLSTAVLNAANGAAWGTEVTGASAKAGATLTPSGGSPAPTGTVTYTFFTNGTCSGTGSAQTVDLTPSSIPDSAPTGALGGGSYSYKASYSGDSTYGGSTSGCDAFSVGVAPTTMSSQVFDASTNEPWKGTELPGAQAYDTSSIGGTVSGFTPTGSVTYDFYASANCTGPVTSSTGTLSSGVPGNSSTTASLGGGAYSYEAQYNGDSNYQSSSSTCETFTVSQQEPSLVTTVDDVSTGTGWTGDEVTGAAAFDTAVIGDLARGPAGVVEPSGTVTYSFYSGNETCSGSASTQEVTVNAATGAVPPTSDTAALEAGLYSYKAVYSGDASYLGATASCEGIVVNKSSPTMTATVDDAATSKAWSGSEVTGASADGTATVTGVAGFTPTGTVTFSFYTVGTCTGTPFASSTETLSGGSVPTSSPTDPLAPGTYYLQATYSGDSNYLSSSGACLSFMVSKASPAVGDTVDDAATSEGWAGTEVTGSEAFDRATVTGVEGFTPTGSVTYEFFETGSCAGTPFATQVVSLAAGAVPASSTTAALGAGSYAFEAQYSGDPDYLGNDSSCALFQVLRSPTTTAQVVFDVPPGGDEVTGTAAYDTSSVAPGIAGFSDTGTVTYFFYRNATCSGEVEGEPVDLVGGAVPSSSTTVPLAPGTYSFQASYSGDPNYLGSTSTCQTFSVAVALPALAQVVYDGGEGAPWSGTQVTGASAYDTATLAGVDGFTPTGSVTYDFYGNGTCSGEPTAGSTVPITDGAVPDSFTEPNLPDGTFSFMASYGGDTDYSATTSSCEAITVAKAASSTVETVEDSATQSPWSGTETQGASAYDTATVTGVLGFTPTGTVTYSFYDNGSCGGAAASTETVTVSGGSVPASSPTGELKPGTFSYRAAYSGNADYLASTSTCAAITANPGGYRLEGGDGGVFAFHASYRGSVGFPSPPGLGLHIYDFVGIAATVNGYWLVESNGGIFNFGDARYFGSLPARGISVNDIVGIAATADGKGYWMVSSDGAVYPFGDAVAYGSLPAAGVHVDDIVGIDSPDSGGYWLVGSDGGVYSFGDAHFRGSCGQTGSPCFAAHDIVGMASPDSGGYWLVGSDGGVFTFGDAHYHGSCPASLGCSGVSDIVGIAAPDASGYWLAGADGSLFNFGDAKNFGNEVGGALTRPIVGIASL